MVYYRGMKIKYKQSGWRDFIDLCRSVQTDEELSSTLSFLFTPEEKEHMALRIELVRALLKGELTQRDIAKELEISIATITRGSNGLKLIEPELREALVERLV